VIVVQFYFVLFFFFSAKWETVVFYLGFVVVSGAYVGEKTIIISLLFWRKIGGLLCWGR
jgi:hypothetical protein